MGTTDSLWHSHKHMYSIFRADPLGTGSLPAYGNFLHAALHWPGRFGHHWGFPLSSCVFLCLILYCVPSPVYLSAQSIPSLSRFLPCHQKLLCKWASADLVWARTEIRNCNERLWKSDDNEGCRSFRKIACTTDKGIKMSKNECIYTSIVLDRFLQQCSIFHANFNRHSRVLCKHVAERKNFAFPDVPYLLELRHPRKKNQLVPKSDLTINRFLLIANVTLKSNAKECW